MILAPLRRLAADTRAVAMIEFAYSLPVVVALGLGAVSVVSPLVASSPIFVVLMSFVFLRGVELLTGRIVAGTVLTVLGIYLITTGR